MGFLPINLAGVKPIEEFVYPPGDYLLQIKDAKCQSTKDGHGFRFVIRSTILQGPGASLELQNKPYTHSFVMQGSDAQKTETVKQFFRTFCDACGVGQQIDQAGGQIAEEWFTGKTYIAWISVRDGFFNAGKIRPANAWTYGGQTAAPTAPVPQPGMLTPMPGVQPPIPQQLPPQQAVAPQPQQMVQQPVQPPMQQYQQPVQPPMQPQQMVQQPPQQMMQPPVQQPVAGAPAAMIPTPAGPPQMTGNGQPGVPAPAAQPGFPAPPPPASIPGQGQG